MFLSPHLEKNPKQNNKEIPKRHIKVTLYIEVFSGCYENGLGVILVKHYQSKALITLSH